MIGAGLVDLGLLEPRAYPLEQLNEALAAVESQANGFTNFHITHA
jgi:alcohol dehydrogenase